MRIRGHVVTIVIATAIAGTWAIVYLAGAGALPSFDDRYDVRLRVPTASGLAAESKVTIAGLRVGKVTEVERATGGGALVKFEVDGDHAPIPGDSTAAIRLHSLVGENYVEIQPGQSRTELPDGGTVRVQQGNEYVDADQILSALRGDVRDRTREFISGLGAGVRGRGEGLNRIAGGATGALHAGARAMHTLRDDHARIARLVDNLGAVSRAIGDRGESVRELAAGLRGSLEALASRDDSLRAMLSRLPGALRQVQRTSVTLSRVSKRTGPALGDLAGAVQGLKPAFSLLHPAAGQGRAIVDELGRAVAPLQTTLAGVRRLSRPAAAAMPQVRAVLCEANPALRYLSPYAREIPSVLTNMASASNYYDANGHGGRLLAMAGENSLVGWNEQMSQAANELLKAGLLAKLHYRGFNPYPKPGKAGDVVDGAGVAPGASSGKHLRYTRVEADC